MHFAYHSTIHGAKSQVHLQFCEETIDRTGDKDYSSLAAALVQVVLEKYTLASHAVYMKLHSERGLFHMQPGEC
jgi:Pyruvate/2-oxoacid:ferredoxin oxidoreductase gamma subunit